MPCISHGRNFLSEHVGGYPPRSTYADSAPSRLDQVSSNETLYGGVSSAVFEAVHCERASSGGCVSCRVAFGRNVIRGTQHIHKTSTLGTDTCQSRCTSSSPATSEPTRASPSGSRRSSPRTATTTSRGARSPRRSRRAARASRPADGPRIGHSRWSSGRRT